MEYVTYIIKSTVTEKYYCGQTSDFQKRLDRHNQGRNKYTKHGKPWTVVLIIPAKTRSEAVLLESKIKKRGILRYIQENIGG